MEINVLAWIWENRCKSCDRWYSADDILYRWPQPQTEVTDLVFVVTWNVYVMYFSFSWHMCMHMCIYKYVLSFICSVIFIYCKYTFWSIYLFKFYYYIFSYMVHIHTLPICTSHTWCTFIHYRYALLIHDVDSYITNMQSHKPSHEIYQHNL